MTHMYITMLLGLCFGRTYLHYLSVFFLHVINSKNRQSFQGSTLKCIDSLELQEYLC